MSAPTCPSLTTVRMTSIAQGSATARRRQPPRGGSNARSRARHLLHDLDRRGQRNGAEKKASSARSRARHLCMTSIAEGSATAEQRKLSHEPAAFCMTSIAEGSATARKRKPRVPGHEPATFA